MALLKVLTMLGFSHFTTIKLLKKLVPIKKFRFKISFFFKSQPQLNESSDYTNTVTPQLFHFLVS